MKIEARTNELHYHGDGWANDLWDDCANAKTSIHISALSLQPPTPRGRGHWPELWDAWKNAALRGVQIDFWMAEPTPVHPATGKNYSAGEALAQMGAHPHYVKMPRLLHAKTVCIDRAVIWIGSGNFTAAAAHHNHEAYLSAYCPTIAEQLIKRWESLA